MLPGPVFNLELMTTARRARYYVARSVYGLLLLFLLWQFSADYVYRGAGNTSTVSPRRLAALAIETFQALTVAQGIAVLALTPVLFAGVIADEKQRRTLQYLLSSRLTSGEIVLGKLAARLLHVGVTLGVALPIISLMTLLGGVPPALVVAADLVTASSAFFLAGVSLLVSVYCRKVREAILVVYLFELLWLVGLPLVLQMLRWGWPGGYVVIGPVLDWAFATSPVWTWWESLRQAGAGPLFQAVGWTVGLQVGLGALFVALAAMRLRPVYQRQSAEGPRRVIAGRRLTPRPTRRPLLGFTPMMWKELHVGRRGGLARWVVRVVFVLGLLLVGYWGLFFGEAAARELMQNGYGVRQPAREDFSSFVRIAGTLLFVLWMLGLAAAAASSISAEREEDTWVSLLTTRLEPDEIILAKMAGAVWGLRALGAVLLVIWTSGLVLGAVHPLGFVAVVVAWVAFSGFAVALGTHVSLRARTTTRATAITVTIMVLLNGGYLLCCLPAEPDTLVIVAGCSPFIIAGAPITYGEFWDLLAPRRNSYELWEGAVAYVIAVLGYGMAAIVLTTTTITGFDAEVDRPRRTLLTYLVGRNAPATEKVGPIGDDRDWR